MLPRPASAILRVASTALALLLLPAFASNAHAQNDVIRGRITAPDSTPIEGATVIATSLSGNVSRSQRTGKDGRYTINFPGQDGDYFINVSAVGYLARRFEIKRTADQEVLIADARLQRNAAVLDPVRVTGERQRPQRGDNNPDIGGSALNFNPGNISADMMGDLAAMAASMPGVQYIPGVDGGPGGYSVLGLTPDQNATTLNGLNYGGNNLPRDAGIASGLATSPYDVSRGGFSGGQMSIRTLPGSNFKARTASMFLDAPQLQWTDPAGRALGQQYTNVSASGMVSGPIAFDKSFYNLSWQLGRRSNDLQTLLNTDPLGLQAAGISKDSVDRLTAIIGPMGIPSYARRTLDDRASDNGSVFGSFDFNPPYSVSGQTYNLTFSGNWGRVAPVGGSVTELPAHTGERINWSGTVQGRQSMYFGFGVLSETSVGFSRSRNYGEPYLDMPNGAVRVNSAFADGTSSLRTLSFGGNPSLSSSGTTDAINFMNVMSWFSQDNKHRIKLTEELRRESADQIVGGNLLGTFSFNSLADLQAGKAASYTRQLGERERNTSQMVGAVSLGDSYRPSDALQIQYGVRVDGNKFLSEPDYNSQVEALFAKRNDNAPSHYYVSPRVGFSWTYGADPQASAFMGAARGPRAVVRGGVGVFQNTPSTQLIGGAMDATGLPSGIQSLNCVGSAAPIPNWSSYAADASTIPERCADGSVGTVFASSVPNVTLFSSDFQPSRAIRGNLQWAGPVLDNRFRITADATFSQNVNQQSAVDLNFDPTTRFTLNDEGGRPVYAKSTSIVPTTGAIGSRDARLHPEFARVNEMRSDLESQSRQLRLGVNPMSFNSRISWGLNYVYSNVREQSRGFSGSTTGNPLDVEWGRSSFDSRHQVSYNLGYNIGDAVRVSWFGSFRSGNPYTPMIGGDVNGDGLSNDRAYIFDPSKATDPALATAMKSLIDDGSAEARDCLRSQIGRLASRNSCQGPWTSQANLSLSLNPLKFRMNQRANLSFQVSNPLGAADLLLHGENDLRGWGQSAQPDQNLLYVRGFDAGTQRFKYEVNQRFGSTRPQTSTIRSPVTVTAMLRFDIGPTRERQMLLQQLDRGRKTTGNKVTEQVIKAMFGSAGVPNPMQTILRQADTLQLTTEQADSVAILARNYNIHVDSIWTPVAKYLAGLPNQYDDGEAYGRYKAAREATIDLLIKLSPTLKTLLTPSQLRMLPPFITSSMDTRYLASIRSGTAGMAGGGAGMPMMMGGGGGMTIVTGGGGGAGGATVITQIIR